MSMYLKIENPGVCPIEGFVLSGATSKRLHNNPFTIGQFGSGNKHAVNVLLRSSLYPVVFCSNHKLEFGVRAGRMKALEGDTSYNRVVVKHGGVDENGTHVSYTEELSHTEEYGAIDWSNIGMALREFVSNAIDATIVVNEASVNQHKYPWDGVKIEIVSEEKVRAKKNYTRVFIPVNEDVIRFFANLGKWFLHFSEPDNICQEVLPKNNRNLGEKQTAVIYRRGVYVREIQTYASESLFDYNINDLSMDECRNVDDYRCHSAAANTLKKADARLVFAFLQSFGSDKSYWEHTFSHYDLQPNWLDSAAEKEKYQHTWQHAMKMLGDSVVLSTKEGPQHTLTQKGYKVLVVPEAIMLTGVAMDIATPVKILSVDEINGLEISEPTQDAILALDWVWDLITKAHMTDGKSKPDIKCFRKVMDGGIVTQGFARDGKVYVNLDTAYGSSVALRQVILEECAHILTGSADETRDLQDWAFKLAVRASIEDSPIKAIAA